MKHPLIKAAVVAAQAAAIKRIDLTADKVLQRLARIALELDPADMPKYADVIRAAELLAKHLGVLKDAPPPAQWNLDPATLGKMSTEDLETALKHAETVQNLLAGKNPDNDPQT